MNVDICALGLNSKLDACNDFELAGFERDGGRRPVGKILGIDEYLVRNSWRDVVKLKVSVFGSYDGAALAAISSLQHDGRLGDWIAVYVGNCTDDAARF